MTNDFQEEKEYFNLSVVRDFDKRSVSIDEVSVMNTILSITITINSLSSKLLNLNNRDFHFHSRLSCLLFMNLF
jgi:hypothetical protein